MKIWIKIIIGTIIGLIIGLYTPDLGGDLGDIFAGIGAFVIRIGRYALFPLLFFGLCVGTYELRTEKKMLSIYLWTLGTIVIVAAALIFLGIITLFIIPQPRIPIINEEGAAVVVPKLQELLFSVFPENLFSVFASNGSWLLPITFLAVFWGLNLTFDKFITDPVVDLLDSLSRVAYHINSLATEILGIAMIALSISMVFDFRSVSPAESDLYSQLVITIVFLTVFLVLIAFPLVLYFWGKRENPFRWLYSQIAAGIAAFVSRDVYFSLGTAMKYGKETMGIPRSVGTVTYTLTTLFGRAGSAMISAMCFMVVLTSYFSLEIQFHQYLWIFFSSFSLLLVLGAVPGLGVMVGLAYLTGLYGRGVEAGYLILKPIFPLLLSLGALLDSVIASFVSYLVAVRSGEQRSEQSAEYI